ncbi:hypothetical protein B0T26DRAFT_676905 [Lasiosphaeria miniovina]|uniref:DUF967 domain protein n=1 Tax=Lasiosphaeria miniovina TaxID=1954250 RepID=A0AA40DT37_9PEZI|nr:uncharacterized protein B0T26DRAFT_676905 [Lasiosphaeria miniovina]KAK0712446.1 hypothetical protein B0T26DRAFT_676905 [Lasiosphaeria miniovina]
MAVYTRNSTCVGSMLSSKEARDATPIPINIPPSNLDEIKKDCDSFTFDAFTSDDAWELGHLLHARLALLAGTPTLISISLANSSQVVFQCVSGPGTAPDNETWVKRKRNSVLRWDCSTWYLHCKYGGDEEAFRLKFGMSAEQASQYAIHGGAVPIRVRGVEGVVAVVVVSGLKQAQDHGVIVDVIKENWHRV